MQKPAMISKDNFTWIYCEALTLRAHPQEIQNTYMITSQNLSETTASLSQQVHPQKSPK